MMAGENIESSAFRQVYNKLSTGIRAALPSLAEVAFAKELIHDNTHNEAINLNVAIEVRTSTFLNALRDRIRTDPSAFHRFVDILHEEHSMEYLAKIMTESETRAKIEKNQRIARDGESGTIVSTLVGETITPGHGTMHEWHARTVPHASKPTRLPIHLANDSNYHPTSFNEMHGSGKYVYPVHYAGPRSEPAVKYAASPAMAFSSHSGPRVAESNCTGEFNAPTRRAITPDYSQKILVTGPMGGDTTKMFRKTYTYSDLHLALDLSSIPSPLGNPTTSPKYPPAVTESHHHPINPELLTRNFAQLNVSNSVASRSPSTGTSTAANDRKPSTANPTTTNEPTSSASHPQDSVKEHPDHGDFLTSDSGHYTASTTHAQENPQNKQHNFHGFEVTTTAPTPQEAQPNQLTAPPGNESNITARGEKSHIGCSGITESQTTEPGSNFLSYHQISRHPSLHSSSSVESNDSSICDSAEIDPIQASEENPGEGEPLVSGGIKPGSCSNHRANRQNRQRCKHCTRLKKESIALKEELNKVKRTLSSEREQSNKQVNDLKEQLYGVEQKATGFTHHIYNLEQRHQDAERTIHKLRRELQLLEAEKFHLKNAYDVCLARCDTMKAELERADSLQCPDYEDYHTATNEQNPMAMQHQPEQVHGYRSHRDPHRGPIQNMYMYDNQLHMNQQQTRHTMYTPVHTHTL